MVAGDLTTSMSSHMASAGNCPETRARRARKRGGSADERPCCGMKHRRIWDEPSADEAHESSSCQ